MYISKKKLLYKEFFLFLTYLPPLSIYQADMSRKGKALDIFKCTQIDYSK